MLRRQKKIVVTCIMVAFLAVLMCGASIAQQVSPASIWQLAPPGAVMVAGYDGRADSTSVQAILGTEAPETRDLRLKQEVAMRKAVESFATLFGISLDFAKDIDSWSSQQWAFVVLPDGKGFAPVFLLASNDAAAANAALQKILEPWQRLGEIAPETDSDFAITAIKAPQHDVEAYASVTGSVMAFSPSKAALKQALQGGGFAADSAANKALTALSGSMIYAFADSKMLKMAGMKERDIPLSGLGIGVSVVDTGAKLRLIGYLSAEGAVLAKQMLPVQPAPLVVNAGIPDPSLIAASLPDLSAAAAMFGMFGGADNPMSGALMAIGGTQLSASVTAALPMPAGVVTAMAASEADAAAKLERIVAGISAMKYQTKPKVLVAGIQTTSVTIPKFTTMYLAQIGQHVVLASDSQSLSAASKAIKGEKPGMAQTETYKETMAALGNSNLMTMYVNLAPIQGLGYLAESLGVEQVSPLYGSFAKTLEEMKALGVGVGFDGEAVNATLFLRAKPGIGPGMGAAAVYSAAIGAAVLFPVFERAREVGRKSTCQSNLKQIALAAHMYASDNNGKLPTAANWRAQLEAYMPGPRTLMCPDGDAIIAFNKNLGGLIINKIQKPSEVVMFFEADPSLPNATGSRADAILPHDGYGNFAYADGHVKSSSDVPDQSHWVAKYTAPKPVKKAPVRKAPAKSRR